MVEYHNTILFFFNKFDNVVIYMNIDVQMKKIMYEVKALDAYEFELTGDEKQFLYLMRNRRYKANNIPCNDKW